MAPSAFSQIRKKLQKLSGGRQAGEKTFVYGSLTPLMVYMMLFSLFPILWAIALSFFDYSPVRSSTGFLGLGDTNSFVGLGNFRAMFSEISTGQPLSNCHCQYLYFFIFGSSD